MTIGPFIIDATSSGFVGFAVKIGEEGVTPDFRRYAWAMTPDCARRLAAKISEAADRAEKWQAANDED